MKGDLHITNGDAAANLLKASGLEGDVLPWRDPMHHGPSVAGLDLDAVSAMRARYLAGQNGSVSDVGRDFRLRNEHLRAVSNYSEVILWFEHDLLDQLQILQLLDWFSGAPSGTNERTMICIDHFPTKEPFRGLGQLSSTEILSLFPARRPVTQAQLNLAKAGWAAFRSEDPIALEALVREGLAPLPFLHAAFVRHLEEYPWSSDRLTRTERQILKLVSEGISGPGKVFAANMDLETSLFEGDLRTFQHIADLCSGADPLLHCEPHGTFRFPPNVQISREDLLGQKLTVTDTGKCVLSGQQASSMERDEWLGGVHLLTGQPMWTWNSAEGRMRLEAA